MKTVEEELQIIKLITCNCENIKVKEDGFMSRGYVVNNGELVFKFPRNNSVKYDEEIENLNFINSLNLDVNLQRVAYTSKTNEYLGIYGVVGKSLEEINLSQEQKKSIGQQLGVALKKLHQTKHETREICSLDDEISAWQKRVFDVSSFIESIFCEREQNDIKTIMLKWAPEKLAKLGEKLVYSHGDLGDGNIFVDENGKVGIIDFSESCLLDEAADFMDVKDEEICDAMLLSYGADDTLKEKVFVRRLIRPLVVLKPYVSRGNQKEIEQLVGLVRKSLNLYSSTQNIK